MNRLATQFLTDLIAGNTEQAKKRVRKAVRDRASLKQVYLNVFRPVQWEISRLEAAAGSGRLTNASLAIACQEVLEEFAELTFSVPARGIKTLVCTVPGELHSLGPRLVADLLYLDGIDTTFVPFDTFAEVEETIAGSEFELMLIAVPNRAWLPLVRRMRNRAREIAPELIVVAGGRNLWPEYQDLPPPQSEAAIALQRVLAARVTHVTWTAA